MISKWIAVSQRLPNKTFQGILTRSNYNLIIFFVGYVSVSRKNGEYEEKIRRIKFSDRLLPGTLN